MLGIDSGSHYAPLYLCIVIFDFTIYTVLPNACMVIGCILCTIALLTLATQLDIYLAISIPQRRNMVIDPTSTTAENIKKYWCAVSTISICLYISLVVVAYKIAQWHGAVTVSVLYPVLIYMQPVVREYIIVAVIVGLSIIASAVAYSNLKTASHCMDIVAVLELVAAVCIFLRTIVTYMIYKYDGDICSDCNSAAIFGFAGMLSILISLSPPMVMVVLSLTSAITLSTVVYTISMDDDD